MHLIMSDPYANFHAVGPGKQLPPRVAQMQKSENSDVVVASSTDATPSSASCWTVRDAAYSIVEERKRLLRDSAPATRKEPAPVMTVGTDFEIDKVLRQLQKEQTATVRQAFQCAATAVLQAILQQKDQQPKCENLDYENDLPPQVLERHPLDALRKHSLERSYENNLYAKRKDGKRDADYVPPRQYKRPSHATTKNQTVSTTTIISTPVATTTTTTPQLPPTSSSLSSLLITTEAPPPSPVAIQSATTPKSKDKSLNPIGSTLTTTPKFPRNTPASSGVALDNRFQSSRAVVCIAAGQVWDKLTPSPYANTAQQIDSRDVPPAMTMVNDNDNNNANTLNKSSAVNMGAVLLEAKVLSERILQVTFNAVRRANARAQYRQACARTTAVGDLLYHPPPMLQHNPFAYRIVSDTDDNANDDDDDDDDIDNNSEQEMAIILCQTNIRCEPDATARTLPWQSSCLPLFIQVLQTGPGHAIYLDTQWPTRHGRLANLLTSMVDKTAMGPNLIICTEPNVERYAREFSCNLLNLIVNNNINNNNQLRALVYRGKQSQRRKLREYFPSALGLPESPVHVLITSYSTFLEDYFHFCALPFDSVILDDGVACLAMKDQSSSLGTVFGSALFSFNDQHYGLAGTSFKEWDFSQIEFPEATLKEAWVGLTVRHRILTTSSLVLQGRATATETVPVESLLEFLLPQFMSVVREEWFRSKITSDKDSMSNFTKLLARSVIVHSAETPMPQDPYTLAHAALTGSTLESEHAEDASVPVLIPDDDFVSSGKIATSRRSSLQWLGNPSTSWLRYELGRANLEPIIEAMKLSNYHGTLCEEITTASSTTSSGANGQVVGTMAYRLAVRCGRHFGSDAGLRQHIAGHHAPAGTWLCRTCSNDCLTSQARTHHERTCGQVVVAPPGEIGRTVLAPTKVGQVELKAGVGKKKGGRGAAGAKVTAVGIIKQEEKDPDGSFRLPGYRGVWLSSTGKHFLKIQGKRFTTNSDQDEIVFFDSADKAAKKYDDEVVRLSGSKTNTELNFKSNGSRIVYDDAAPATISSIGGSAQNVVPQLSQICIRDLPPDVKPLLRDPRQTSRTGGNSKRHVYAYRGVCRQTRKGHDRWQSQISFMGTNHYLGTFDSEWDAAAIYAWAHLILYGEEATRQAQKEGEEAAAAYEQEQKDIAAGKTPDPPPKLEKKKVIGKKKKEKKAEIKSDASVQVKAATKGKKRKTTSASPSSPRKKVCPNLSKSDPKTEKEAMTPTLAKGVAKVPMLARRDAFQSEEDATLIRIVAEKLDPARKYCSKWSSVNNLMRSCIPGHWIKVRNGIQVDACGAALMVGLSPSSFEWDLQEFVDSFKLQSEQDIMNVLQLLAVEYDDEGVNEKFRCLLQGHLCMIGSASKLTQLMNQRLGFGSVSIGGYVGMLDCHVGGTPGSCSERAALIRYMPTTISDFQFLCLSDDDMVTLNGQRLLTQSGPYPIFHGDVCSVGARVFAFLLPSKN